MTVTHWVCEFRNGFYLQADASAAHSGVLKTAKRFDTQLDAARFILTHEGGWVAMNGGVEKHAATCGACGTIQPVPSRSSSLVSKVLWWCSECFETLEARCP